MSYEKKRLLVVVKTYPNPSHAYGETVCCAGVDLATGHWVRMYPITFRRLAGKQFAKYQIIECQAAKPRKGDFRPESLRIDQDTIKLVGDPLPASPAKSGSSPSRRESSLCQVEGTGSWLRYPAKIILLWPSTRPTTTRSNGSRMLPSGPGGGPLAIAASM